MDSLWAFLRAAVRNIVKSPLTSALVSPAIGIELLHFFGVHIPGFSDADLWTHVVVITATIAGLIAGDPDLSDRARAAIGRVLLIGLLAGGLVMMEGTHGSALAQDGAWSRLKAKVERQVDRLPGVRKLRKDLDEARFDLGEVRLARRALVRDLARARADVARLERELLGALSGKAAAEWLRHQACPAAQPAPHVPPCDGGKLVCALERKG